MKILFYLFILFYSTGFTFPRGGNEEKQLSLKQALEIALKYNPQLIKAAEKINALRGRALSGISLPMPEISATYEYIPNGKPLKNPGEKTIEIKQSFNFPSTYYYRGSKANDEKSIAECEFTLTKISVISQIKTVYYNYLAKQQQIKISEENLKIAEDFYKKAEIRFNFGEGNNLEKLTAKVQFTEAKNNNEIQKNLLRSAYTELISALGLNSINDNPKYNLTDSLTYHHYEISLEGLYKNAQSANPEFRIGELSLQSAATSQKLAWSSLLPSFNISYSKQTLDNDPDYYGASLGISIPLWFLFDQRGQIQESNANVLMAEADRQSVNISINLKINNAFNDFKNADKQVQMYIEDILPQSEEIYRVASKSYEAGEISYLEYLQSKQTLINSKNNYIGALLAFNLAICSLEQAVGISISN
jgi:outer membrane protein, heavy metal efflux system